MMTSPPPSADRPRCIVGNLDCEAEFQRRFGRGQHGNGELPGRVKSALSAAGTLLRVFAHSSADRLWLPAAVDAKIVAAVPGLPTPMVVTGPLTGLDFSEFSDTLAWGATDALGTTAKQDAGDAAGDWTALPVHEVVWQLPRVTAAVAARVNHRGLALRVATELGMALPGARMVTNLAEWSAHMAADGAVALAAAETGVGTPAWVAKAPLSAAGRERVIGTWRDGKPTETARIATMLAGVGELLVEPWMPRTADYGVTGFVTATAAVCWGVHRQDVDDTGRFLGTTVGAFRGADVGVASAVAEVLRGTFFAVADRLREADYRGPVGIDAWTYRTADGTEKLHPLGEINARLTFGIVARAFAERLASSHVFAERMGTSAGPPTQIRLCVAGLRRDSRVPTMDAGVAHRVPVVWAAEGEGDTAAAWLDIFGRNHGFDTGDREN